MKRPTSLRRIALWLPAQACPDGLSLAFLPRVWCLSLQATPAFSAKCLIPQCVCTFCHSAFLRETNPGKRVVSPPLCVTCSVAPTDSAPAAEPQRYSSPAAQQPSSQPNCPLAYQPERSGLAQAPPTRSIGALRQSRSAQKKSTWSPRSRACPPFAHLP